MATTDAFTALVDDPEVGLTLGPHPIFDDLIASEPEGSHVRERFGLGHRDALALEPDKVHDPAPPHVITHARVISATPTGSLMLDMGPGRSVALSLGTVRAAEYSS
jgi:hypothetical protein